MPAEVCQAEDSASRAKTIHQRLGDRACVECLCATVGDGFKSLSERRLAKTLECSGAKSVLVEEIAKAVRWCRHLRTCLRQAGINGKAVSRLADRWGEQLGQRPRGEPLG